MPVTPANLFSLPLKALQDTIANSGTFQTWAGTAGGAPTLARIHLVGVDVSAVVRPFALIDFGEKFDSAQIAYQGQFMSSGELLLLFEDAVAPANAGNHGDAKLAFTNQVGAVLNEIQDVSGQNSFLSIHKIKLKSGPNRSTKDERDAGTDLYQVTFEVVWGV